MSEHSSSPIRVFISYSHDSDEHKERVLALSELLLHEGIDAHLDRYETSPPEGWANWMLNQISDAQWVLMVCTERYHQRVRGHEEPGSGLGVRWEGAIITQTLYEGEAKNTKFVPIIFTSEDHAFIPIFLRSSAYFLLPSRYEDLYRHLRREPLIKKGIRGPLRDLQSKTIRPLPTGSRSAAFQEEIELDLRTARKLQEEAAIQGGDLSVVKARILDLERKARRGWEPEKDDVLSGRFRLIERVGSGNYGTVWKTYDQQSEEFVAVKILKGESGRDESRRNRFFRGARTMARLNHPGIVRIIEPEIEADGLSFYAMEYVSGDNLQAAILEGKIDQAEGLRVLLAVGEAVAYAHHRNYIHRDIKPSNILLDPQGNPKLTDFDLVLAPESTGGTQNEPLGTWLYMAPEAQIYPSSVTTKADTFSLGMTALFILAQRPPAEFPYNRELFMKNLDCSVAIKESLLPAVEVDPSIRYPSVEEFCRNLQKALQEEAQTLTSLRMAREENRSARDDSKTATRRYMFQTMVSHLHAAGNWERLFSLIETKPFLADQARHLSGFEHGSSDLESYAIPATIQKSDWIRFFHYSILALNLRGMAERLAQPKILKSFSKAGYMVWATSIVDLLSDPLDRAEALATIAESCDPRNPDKIFLVERLRAELGNIPSASRWTDVEYRTEALCNIGRRLGPELYGNWGSWISEFGLGVKEARRVRRAIVESWIDRGDIQTSRFWERLRAMDDPSVLLEIVRNRLSSHQVVLPRGTIDRLEPLFQGRADLFHRARAILLGRQARENPARTSTFLTQWLEGQESTWSPELIEDAVGLITYMSPADLDLVAQRLPTPLLRAALRVIALEGLSNATRAAEALKEVKAISEPAVRLHWSLRYLAARPRVPIASYLEQLQAVRDYLRSVQYRAASEDLCRFLDLIAEVLPSNLKHELEVLLMAPGGSPEVVTAIVDGTKTKAVAELLLEKAEHFAAATAQTEDVGFRLRYSLITKAVCRLCILTGDLSFLEHRTDSLAIEEGDELRSQLAPLLAEIENRDPRQPRLSSLVCDGIQNPRLRLLTLLKIAPPEELFHALQPASLYRTMFDVAKLEDELLGLAILQSLPVNPLQWIRQNLLLSKEPLHSARVALRFAWHTLRAQSSELLKQELVDILLQAGEDKALTSLTPQIVEFVAYAGKTERATEEFQKAAYRLLTSPFIWAFRLEAFENLLAIFRKVFLSDLLDAGQTVPVLKAFLRLPLDLKPKANRAEIRDQWPKVLPMIIGTLQHLPQRVQSSCFRHLEASVRVLSPDHQWFSVACCFGLTERLDLARQILEDPEPDRDQVVALVYLLARSAPDLIVQLLANCLAEKDRSSLCLRLIRHGWVSREINVSLRKKLLIEDRLHADIWTYPRRPTEAEDWLRTLGDLLGDLDLSDPSTEPLIHELWACPPNIGHPVLAAAVAEVLRSRGRDHAESALRIWLHSFLAPSLGSENSQGQARVTELRQVLRKAETLPAT